MKLAFNIIYRDNEDVILDCLNSTLPANAEEYVFCDTGSIDKTTTLIEGWGKQNGKTITIKKFKDIVGFSWADVPKEQWHFGRARQIALSNTKADFMIWIDTDDVLENAAKIPEFIQFMEDNKVDQIFFPYRYGVDQNNNDIIKHDRERIIRIKEKGKSIAQWEEPIHEYVMFLRPVVSSRFDIVKWKHQRKAEHVKRTSRRNLEVMMYEYRQLTAQGLPKRLRLLQNIAYDHWEHQEWDLSAKYYGEFLELYKTLSLNNPEKVSHSLQYTYNLLNWTKAEIELQHYEKAQQLIDLIKGTDEVNQVMYLLLAELRFSEGSIESAELYLRTSEMLNPMDSMLPVNQWDIRIRTFILWAKILKQKGQFALALQKLQEIRQQIGGNHSGINVLVGELNDLLIKNSLYQSYSTIKNELFANGDWLGLRSLMLSVPYRLGDQQDVLTDIKEIGKLASKEVERLKIQLPEKKNIAIYTGRAFEAWAGDSREKGGIGGSEEMAIGVARHFAMQGHIVTVFGDPREKAGEYEGVMYVDATTYDPKVHYDLLIVSRIPQMIVQQAQNGALAPVEHNADRKWLWLHDTHYGQLSPSMFGQADRVLVLSEFHKDVISKVHNVVDNKFFVTRNGLEVEHYKKLYAKHKPKRNPKKIIYASSYDRGLLEFCQIIKDIKKEIPDIEATVYYGWNTYLKRAEQMPENYSDHPSGMSMKQYYTEVTKLMEEVGIKDGGRIGQDELFLEMARSNVWLYPTWFSETSCLTAMRAQLAGAIPVHTGIAALSETVKHGKQIQFGEWDEFKKTVIDLINNPDESLREKMMGDAEQFDIALLVKEWDNYLNEDYIK